MRTEATYAWLTCLLALAACTQAPAQANGAPELAAHGIGGGLEGEPRPEYDFGYTERIGQLTGTPQNPLQGDAGLGLVGTDLGISYERNGELYFLFGDSWTDQPFLHPDLNLDSVAHTSLARPEGTPQLEWVTRGAGSNAFRPLMVPKVDAPDEFYDMGVMSVPVEAISNGSSDYLFFHITPLARDEAGEVVFDELGRATFLPALSVLAEASADFSVITTHHAEVNTHFKSVSTLREGDYVYIYGADVYRNSAIYLAKAPFSTITDRSTWTYYDGQAGIDFVEAENDEPLIPENCVGELSVRKHPTEALYFMTYNCGTRVTDEATGNIVDGYPHEIRLRTARHPEGPWSAYQVIVEKHEGDGHFVHAPGPHDVLVGPYDDGLGFHDYAEPGDVYGPYLIPQWFSDPAPGVHEIVYTLSTWNPYQVHLMRTVLTDPGVTVTRPAPVDKPNPRALQNADFADGISGWTEATGGDWNPDAFQKGSDGWAITTRVMGPEVNNEGFMRGYISQSFDVGPQSILSFEVAGGDGAVVKLIHEGQVVRATRGNVTEPQTPVPARWDLSSLRGETVELAIEDTGFSNFDYIAVSPFTFSE